MDANERLQAARKAAGYATAVEAAAALGVPYSTYSAHENGEKRLLRAAERYARFFRVSLEWLLTGSGEMKPARRLMRVELPAMGKVGAGAVVDMPDDPASSEAIDDVTISLDGDFVLEVVGNSQYPRYLEGEKIIVEGQPLTPDCLVDTYCVVQVEEDGRRLLKMLRRGRALDTYRLESHNAPPEDNVRLFCGWRIKGVWYG